ncbi:hypothetical protein LUZ60_001320 [Juncus effusus]|nr:hypothetical protein LUZ60_001320 [Juncus effusus]
MSSSTVSQHFFPLTSLQIGDLQSYLSRLSIFLTPNRRKFYILVDNRPWLVDQDTKPTHLWQLMVTKSRRSPFANSKTRRKRSDSGKRLNYINTPRPNDVIINNTRSKWYSLLDAAMEQKRRTLLPVKSLKDSKILNKELHRTLYGFIVFEVEWNNVRGINYSNELQTDTSMALETKFIKRWEFESIEQALTYLSSWYSGSFYERHLLREYLETMSPKDDIFHDAHSDNSTESESESNEESQSSISDDSSNYTPPPQSGPYKRRKIMKHDKESYSEIISSPRSSVPQSSPVSSDSENSNPSFESTTYKNAFILFRFNDPNLPFKLKDTIMSDLKLLTLLEYGLPSWVIFLQSYPLFCNLYRHWMCPFARFLYVTMSIITVLIGFYDLYKNVPLLKVTLSKLFGPFFDWIENWEMISRIKYLGTMLFLHNFEQAVKWTVKVTSSVKSVLTVLTKPVVGPFMEVLELVYPVWNLLVETLDYFGSVIWLVLRSSYTVVIWPFVFLLSTLLSIANYVIYPVVWIFEEILSLPFRAVGGLASYIATLLVDIYYVLKESLLSLSTVFQFGSASKTAVTGVSHEYSLIRSLWNDLFSQIFRALKSILYGFAAFFSACNRHRLSTYNYIVGVYGPYDDSDDSDDSDSSYETPNPSERLRKFKSW